MQLLLLVLSVIRLLLLNLEGEKNVNITLKEDLEQLDEVVVVGYGTQKKSSLTASVATVPAKELSKQMGHSVAAALQGRAPGVEIFRKGGRAGADIKILVGEQVHLVLLNLYMLLMVHFLIMG